MQQWQEIDQRTSEGEMLRSYRRFVRTRDSRVVVKKDIFTNCISHKAYHDKPRGNKYRLGIIPTKVKLKNTVYLKIVKCCL